MKNFIKNIWPAAVVAGALVTCQPAQASNNNVCNSNSVVENARARIFALVEWPETGKNTVTLCNQGELVMISRVSTGRPQKRDGQTRGSYTPEGTFRITERVRQWKTSNLYNGSNGRPARLPYWQRFNGAIGFHYGNVNAPSAGCVRVENAQGLYNNITKIGASRVEVIIHGTHPGR